MEEVRISEWPEAPHAWLPAYGFHREIFDKDDYFSSGGCGEAGAGSREALYLETIVEETSDDLRSERSAGGSPRAQPRAAPGWLCDSDADSVIAADADHAPCDGSECGSGSGSESERESACPAKRRRGASPGSGSSSSLARFESLERSCACAAPASPRLSPDSLESPPASPPPARALAVRARLSAENLSEDSGYSERPRRAPPAPAAGSAPCLAAPAPAPPAGARPPRPRALSLPAELDVCAEPRRRGAHRARFQQTFEVSDRLTVSVADLTALDYRGGGPRRPRLPPPPPPRARRRSPPPHPPPPPPTAPLPAPVPPPLSARESSTGSDSTTESEHAFAREMEATARRLDDTARRALAESGAYDRELSVLTAQRLQNSLGAWDDVLDELRRRMEPASPLHSPSRTPSPDLGRVEPAFSSTPLRAGGERVRSTPELRAGRREPPPPPPAPLRASLQLVAPAPAAPPARSASAGSKGVTFSPVVAEVSWREASATTSTSESAATSDDASDAEVAEVAVAGGEAARAPAADRAADMTDAAARAPRSRIAGFLSRFAKFRFSGRKEKKLRGAGANARPAASQGAGVADSAPAPRAAAAPPQYERIPLKEEGVSAAGARAAPRPPPAPAPATPRAPPAGVLETDVDTARTVLHARSLLALAPPPRAARPHKSMEFLLDKDSAQTVQPPENELQKHSSRAPSEHELRVQRSLQRLHVPDWYKNAPAPRESFILRKRLSDAGAGGGGGGGGGAAGRWGALEGRTTSLGSLRGAAPPPAPRLSPHSTSFGRWSTSRLNSSQTSPCSSARSSVRGASPLGSPAGAGGGSVRASFSARQPYLGWRSQERLSTAPRTPHERLASSLLQQAAAAEEIQSSIKEVTSAIVHYVAAGRRSPSPPPAPPPRRCWLESSFVGTKPLESPQTPVAATQALPPPHPRPPSSLRLERRAAPAAPPAAPVSGVSPSSSEYAQWLPGGAGGVSPGGGGGGGEGAATLEDVLDSLLGLPAPRAPSPRPSPRHSPSPYCLGGKSPRYEPLASSAASSASPASRRASPPRSPPRSPAAAAAHTAGSKDSVDNFEAIKESIVPRSVRGERSRRRSEPCAQAAARAPAPPGPDAAAGAGRRPSLGAAAPAELSPLGSRASLLSLNTENSAEEVVIRCKYSRCSSRTHLADAKRHYKTCHNCATMYCSRECRRAHWEKHRKVCLHSRASVLCRQIISAAKEDPDSLYQISTVAYKGYLAHGRGVVKVFFTSPEAAEKFTTLGYQHLTQPAFLPWPALQPTEMGVELYAELVKLCKSYNPETRVILYASVCIISEVPTKGAVKWERQLVSRCAKLRLSKAVSAAIQEQARRRPSRDTRDTRDGRGTHDTHDTRDGRDTHDTRDTRDGRDTRDTHDTRDGRDTRDTHDTRDGRDTRDTHDTRDGRDTRDTHDTRDGRAGRDTLVLAAHAQSCQVADQISKFRERCFQNIVKELESRGVILKKHFPEVYSRLAAYADGSSSRFVPMTIYPKDVNSGKYFMCVIMPENDAESVTSPADGCVTRVDVGAPPAELATQL